MFNTTHVVENASKLTFHGSREKELFQEILDNYKPDKLKAQDFIAISACELESLKLISYGVNTGVYAACTTKKRRSVLGNIGIERQGLLNVFNTVGKEIYGNSLLLLKILDRASNRNLIWEKVKTVVELGGTREVFDLAVEGTKVFEVDNGLIIYDTMSLSLPHGKKAIDEARSKMNVESNLMSVGHGNVNYAMQQQYLRGLIIASRGDNKKKAIKFNTMKEAEEAYKRGDVDIDTPLIIAK